MEIQLYWSRVHQVSASVLRDILKVQVLQNEHFFSASQQFIAVNSTSTVKIPAQMRKDSFNENMSKAIDSSKDVTNVMLASNIVINIFLSSAMTLLWGMINCIQIVAHFYLVNIQIPANATMMFKMLV